MKEGDKLKDFCLKDQNNNEICTKDFTGKNLIIYFYPKDMTPGCTIEAIDFTKFKKDFSKINTEIIGINKDTCESHKKFQDKDNLSITLLADTDTKVQQEQGVWKLKKFMGREYMGTVRTTFLINKDHKIVKIYNNVRAKDHAKKVLEDAKNLFFYTTKNLKTS